MSHRKKRRSCKASTSRSGRGGKNTRVARSEKKHSMIIASVDELISERVRSGLKSPENSRDREKTGP